ncbi:MAG: nucleotidyltransferase domain-containing protein [Desulfuromonadales bacterium]
MISETLKKEIVDKITSSVHPSKIFLFGSYAYGTPTSDSDLDLAVIIQDVKSKHKESVKLYKLLREIGLPKDIIVSSLEEFDFYKNEPGSIFKTINEKGVVLYAG